MVQPIRVAALGFALLSSLAQASGDVILIQFAAERGEGTQLKVTELAPASPGARPRYRMEYGGSEPFVRVLSAGQMKGLLDGSKADVQEVADHLSKDSRCASGYFYIHEPSAKKVREGRICSSGAEGGGRAGEAAAARILWRFQSMVVVPERGKEKNR